MTDLKEILQGAKPAVFQMNRIRDFVQKQLGRS